MSAELFKLRKRPATWILAGVWLALTLIFGYVIPYVIFRIQTSSPEPSLRIPPAFILAGTLPANLVGNLLSGFPLFVGAIALIMGALSTGSEYGWGTLGKILTQRPGRLSVVAGKLLALVLVLFVLVLATFVLGAASSLLIARIQAQPLDWPPFVELAKGVGAAWLIVTMWGLFGVMLAVLFRGTALAIGLGLVWTLVIESLISGFALLLDFFDRLQKVLPGINAGSLAAALGAPSQRGQGAPGVIAAVGGTQAMIVLLAYAIAFMLIAGWLLKRRDVT